MADDSQQWVTVPEAGRLLNKSERTIHRWVSIGKLPSRKEHGRLFVDVNDVMPVTGLTDPSSVTLLREKIVSLQSQIDMLQAEVEKLTALNSQVAGERDYLRGALAQAMRLQTPAIEQPGRRRWRWPWQADD